MILCLETSASLCSVAIGHEGRLIALKESLTPNDHASMIIKHIDACLSEVSLSLGDIEAVAISQGPGSFTGLRVGVSAAKGICFALGIPLISISTLAALAYGAFSENRNQAYCIPMIEARKEEVYGAIFQRSMDLVLPEQVISLTPHWHKSILGQESSVMFCGSGSQKYEELCLPEKLEINKNTTSSINLLELAFQKHIKKDYCDAKTFKPNYLKLPHITQPRKVI